MTTYSTSTGERIKKSVIDRRIREAKAQKLGMQKSEFGFNFCEEEGCGRSGGDYLDCSHEISVKECLETGRAELAYDVNNIKIRCRFHHQIKDGNNVQLNFNR